MANVAFSLGLLLALAGSTAAHRCAVPRQLVAEMLQKLEGSVEADETPDPSVLLAMNLAGATASDTRNLLLRQVEEEAVKKAQKDMSSGKVALYVLALLSSCQNPRHVQAQGLTVDLVSILQQKTDEEMTKLGVDGIPVTSLFSVSLDTLALCLTGAGGYQEASVALAKRLLNPNNQISVDTRAATALALACVYGHADLQDAQSLLWEALATVANGFLDEQEETGGLIGNIDMQALESTGKFYAPREWDCEQAFARVYDHDYQLPAAIAQVLPALVNQPYLEAASVQCVARTVTLITVHYTITNELQGISFSCSTTVHVPHGSTLLRVLQAAEEEDPKTFSFKTEETSWGPMVVSIHGVAADTNDRTYWQFFGDGIHLQEGVGTYKPHDGEHIQAIFSTY
ncbi:cobalamin binding intrinsic factor [Leptosomus discolor]